MPLEDDFCDIVKKARQGQALSIADVAKMSGLPAGDVTMLERAARPPTQAEVRALAGALTLRLAPLVRIALDGWMPAPTPAEVTGVETVLGDIGGYAVKGYVLYDSGEAIFIDTASNPEAMLEVVDRRRLNLLAVCLTHGHADHAGGLDVILQHRRVPAYLGEGDRSLLGWRPPRDLLVSPTDGQDITVGRVTVRCMTTPGHTPGGVCYFVAQEGRAFCFVGDTLFAGSIGRANPFSLYPVHLESVRRRVLALPARTVLFPGHGPATTVEEEWASNPFGEER